MGSGPAAGNGESVGGGVAAGRSTAPSVRSADPSGSGPLEEALSSRFDPAQVGWRLGLGWRPSTGPLWVPWDRTTGVLGPQGSGKTLDLLVPALLGAPGGALVTLTKVEDLLLTITARSAGGRPCVVFDPFGSAGGGLPELVWDPVAGCADPWVAERRARAFTAGTLQTAADHGGDPARFYAA